MYALSLQQVDDAAKIGLFADGQLQRGDTGAEDGAKLVERAVEAGAFTIELVDEDHAGEPERGRGLPGDFGLDLDAFDGAHHDDGEVRHGQPGLYLRKEVGVTGAVEKVQLAAVALESGQRGRHRQMAFDLFGLGVGDGGAVLDPAYSADHTGVGQ